MPVLTLTLMLMQAPPLARVERVSPAAPAMQMPAAPPVRAGPVTPEMAAATCQLNGTQARIGRDRTLDKLRGEVKLRERKNKDGPAVTAMTSRLKYYTNLYWESLSLPGKSSLLSLFAKDSPNYREVVFVIGGSAYTIPFAYRPLGTTCVVHPGGLRFCDSKSESRAFVDQGLLDRLAATGSDTNRMLLRTTTSPLYYCNYVSSDDVRVFLERLS